MVSLPELRALPTSLGSALVRLLNRGRTFEGHSSQRKSRYELVQLSAIVCGIEFCYAAETAFVSPILVSAGIPMSWMTIIWCFSPVLGMFLSPLLGSLSDSCTLAMGKRRPFILLLSLGIVLGLFLVPNSSTVAHFFGADGQAVRIFVTILGACLLDFCCDACQSPARSYLLDVTAPEDHATGLTMFTIMAGLGGAVGYLIGAAPWDRVPLVSQIFHGQVSTVFTMVAFIFVGCLVLTLTSFPERCGNSLCGNINGSDYEMLKENESVSLKITASEIESNVDFKRYLQSVLTMPPSMRMLCLTNLFSWMSLVCYSLYFTDFVGQSVFHGNPDEISRDYEQYSTGVRFGSFAMAIYSLSCAIYSYNIKELIQVFGTNAIWTLTLTANIIYLPLNLGTKVVYVCGPLVYSMGMLVLGMTRSKLAVVCCSASAGVQYATLFTMPYLVLTSYHQSLSVGILL
ncbi:Membrane-associated transporter protein [Halotydeus destructor]|nr:Membrane-associated transporter protein [Halotydeus destructor]